MSAISTTATILPMLPAAGNSAPETAAILRAQLVGVALSTFLDRGGADAVLRQDPGGARYTLTFLQTGQQMGLDPAVAKQFIPPGADSASLRFELLSKEPTSSGALLARVHPLGSAPAEQTPLGEHAAAGSAVTFSSAAKTLQDLVALAPRGGSAWVSTLGSLSFSEPLHAEQALAAFASGLSQTLPSLGIGYERALARLALSGPQQQEIASAALNRFAQSGAVSSDGAVSGPVSPEPNRIFSAQQAQALADGSAIWSGQAWPGCPLELEFGAWKPGRSSTDRARRELQGSLPSTPEPIAWMRLRLSPPALGPLEIWAASIPGRGHFARALCSDPSSLERLRQALPSFESALASAHATLDFALASRPSTPGADS